MPWGDFIDEPIRLHRRTLPLYGRDSKKVCEGEEEARAQKEAEEARERERLRRDRERLRNGLGIGLFCLGIFYILKRGTEDEKEDNKRFTLSAYNSPNSPSFPLSDAVQGININFSIPLKLF